MIAIRKILIIRAANQAMAFSIPTLAAVLSFVTYGSTQDNLDPVSQIPICGPSLLTSRPSFSLHWPCLISSVNLSCFCPERYQL
jgi:hypothetical protein